MACDFEENVLILWKYMPKYLGVKCHALCNLTLKMVQGKRRGRKGIGREEVTTPAKCYELLNLSGRSVRFYCSFNSSIATS